MKYHRVMLTFSIPFVIITLGIWFYLEQERGELPSLTTSMMHITSTAFEHNKSIPSKYTCDGENISPSISINEVPKDAKSLTLIVDDPDAPSKTWVHWLVWNIDPTTTKIEEGIAPQGIEGTTDFGRTGWGGPCPPSGTHRYFFKLYALDSELTIDESATKKELENAMEGHILDQAELIGLYQKQ